MRAFEGLGSTVAVAAILVGGGYVAYKGIESAQEFGCGIKLVTADNKLAGLKKAAGCVLGNTFKDIADDWGFGASSGNSAQAGKFEMTRQGTISGKAIIGFGQIAIDMNSEGKFVYQGTKGIFGTDAIGVDDSVAFYNCGSDPKKAPDDCVKRPTRVIAIPCVHHGKDVAKKNLIKDPYAAESLDGASLPASDSTVKWDIQMNEAGNDIEAITINAGTLDFCAPHVQQSLENYQRWMNRDRNLGQFGGKEYAAYQYMMADLNTTAALAQVNPFEAGIEKSTVESNIADDVEGQLSTTPEQAAMVKKAYLAGKVKVHIDDPASRQKFYLELYHTKRDSYVNHTNPAFAGIEMDEVEISDITVQNLEMSGLDR